MKNFENLWLDNHKCYANGTYCDYESSHKVFNFQKTWDVARRKRKT